MIGTRQLVIAFAAAGMILSSPLIAQPVPGTEPVPAQLLKGREFLGPDSSLSVEAPTDEWQWLRFTLAEKTISEAHPEHGSAVYMAYQAKSRTAFMFIITTTDSRIGAPNEEFMRGMQSGTEKTSAKMGWEIQNFVFEPADIPVKGASYRYHAKAVRADGTAKYRFGYVGGITKKYEFDYADEGEKESPTFTAFVSSFREGAAGK